MFPISRCPGWNQRAWAGMARLRLKTKGVYLHGVGQVMARTCADCAQGPGSLPKTTWYKKTTEQPSCGDVSSARHRLQCSLKDWDNVLLRVTQDRASSRALPCGETKNELGVWAHPIIRPSRGRGSEASMCSVVNPRTISYRKRPVSKIK